MIDNYQKIMNQERADVNTKQLLFWLIRPRFKNLASKELCERKIQVVFCFLYFKKDAKKKENTMHNRVNKRQKIINFWLCNEVLVVIVRIALLSNVFWQKHSRYKFKFRFWVLFKKNPVELKMQKDECLTINDNK